MTSIDPLGPRDLVLCDFDGTISRHDTGLLVAETLELERFMEIEMLWRAGKMSSRECLRKQWWTIDPSAPAFQELIANLEVNAGFERLVGLAQERGARFVVLSDGLDFYIETVLRRLGLADVEFRANHGVLHEHHVEMRFPYGGEECEHCGNCKTRWLFELRPGFGRIVYIGDGFSDACASQHADVVFAKDTLERLCRERGQEFIPFDTLDGVVSVLQQGMSEEKSDDG